MKKALAIGIDNYPTSPLTGCANDASSFAAIIESNGDGSPNFDIVVQNNVATKAELKKAIVELFSGDNDTAIFYFSGHGTMNGLGGYIVTPDAQQYDEGVSMDEILVIANKSKTKNKIIILDCCYSGAMGSPEFLGGSTSQINEGLVILTASKKDELATMSNGRSLFTDLLLDGLQGGAADLMGSVTPGSLYAYIDQALGAWEQRPVFKTNVTNFTALRVVSAKVPIANLRKLTTYFPNPTDVYQLDPSYEFTNTGVAIDANVAIFKDLQKFQSVNLVVPVDAEFMYFAAQNSKSCKLTALGAHYWRLVKNKRI